MDIGWIIAIAIVAFLVGLRVGIEIKTAHARMVLAKLENAHRGRWVP